MKNLERIIKIKKELFSHNKPAVEEMKDYPWDECLADQMERYGDEETAKKVCGAIKAGMKKSFAEGDSLENACWPGYTAVGLKEVDGRMVPNCVPDKENQSKVKEGFPIPSPEGEDEAAFISRCISEIVDEYPAEGQAYAVCKAKWDEK